MSRPMLRPLVAALAALSLATSAAAQAPSRQADRHAEILRAYGGAYEGPVAGYVTRVGERMANAAGQGGRCRFSVVNSEVVNAFAAPPGCDIYISRGLLALIRTEAELAAVLGHEVGHVAANHAGRRQTRSAITGIGALILGAVTGSSAAAQIAGQVGQLNLLSYSREQEYESDTLSARYLASAGYSPYGLVEMLSALQASDQVESLASKRSEAQPVWSRTHPLTGDRIQRALNEARRAGAARGEGLDRADPYLAQVDGMIWGDDPEQGFVRGRRFLHPGLDIAFTAPADFVLANTPAAVNMQGPGRLRAQFAASPSGGDLTDQAYAVLRQVTGQAQTYAGEPQRTRINGFDAVVLPAQARSSNGMVDVTIAVYAVGRGAFHFVTLAPTGQSRAFDPLIGSFRRLSAEERADARPRRIRVVTVKPGDTVASLSSRMAVEDHRRERFEAINGLERGDELRPGDRVKVVTAG